MMPTYQINHLTHYTYEEQVPVCHNLAHLLPRDSPGHEWLTSEIRIDPIPAIRVQRQDYFGNRMTFFAIQEPHRDLRVTSSAKVRVTPHNSYAAELSVPALSWEQAQPTFAQGVGTEAQQADLLDAFQFTFDSPFVQAYAEVADYVKVSFPPGRPALEAVLDLTRRIHQEFVYDPKTSSITTTLPEIMKTRAGVCQDFAHLQIGCLRSVGLAARYVSGYLLTTPPPGKPRLVGADASHAWLSVYLPHMGWLDLDPTNNLIPSDKHITIAWGRDFGDVSPLRGVILGGGHHTVDVSVDVSPIE